MQRSHDQRQRSAKPATIHAYAQSGDFVGFQRLLKQNPSLLNERNPVVRSHFSFMHFHLHVLGRLKMDFWLLARCPKMILLLLTLILLG